MLCSVATVVLDLQLKLDKLDNAPQPGTGKARYRDDSTRPFRTREDALDEAEHGSGETFNNSGTGWRTGRTHCP